MTRDDIIRMAREAGCLGPGAGGDPNGLWEPHGHENVTELMFKFAALVAAAERKRLAWTQEHWTEYEHSIVAAEREAIAQSLDKQADLAADEIDRQWAQEMAAAVRGRGEKI